MTTKTATATRTCEKFRTGNSWGWVGPWCEACGATEADHEATATARRNAGYALSELQAGDKVGECADCGASLLVDPDGDRTAVLAYECSTCDEWIAARP